MNKRRKMFGYKRNTKMYEKCSMKFYSSFLTLTKSKYFMVFQFSYCYSKHKH